MTPMTAQDVAGQIPRNSAIGTVVMFALWIGGCLAAGCTLLAAVGVAVLPTIISGPFVGGLLTVAAYSKVEGDH
jgi:hypothetical protein